MLCDGGMKVDSYRNWQNERVLDQKLYMEGFVPYSLALPIQAITCLSVPWRNGKLLVSDIPSAKKGLGEDQG